MEMDSKASILVVDDEAFIGDLVCFMLSKLGYEATYARDALEALNVIKDNDGYQLVLTDINMPPIDGWEFALRVKALKPCIPIIALTGESPSNILPKLKDSGICHALFKPIKMNLLGDAVTSILESTGDHYSIECLDRGDEDPRFMYG